MRRAHKKVRLSLPHLHLLSLHEQWTLTITQYGWFIKYFIPALAGFTLSVLESTELVSFYPCMRRGYLDVATKIVEKFLLSLHAQGSLN